MFSIVCTVVVSYEPGSAWPMLVLAVRDEFLGRPWLPPGAHWPQHPDLIGGLDRQAGGTWLAVGPEVRRVACVLNGVGIQAAAKDLTRRPANTAEPSRERSKAAEPKRSRGILPLLGAAGRDLPEDLTDVDPFHLVIADLSGAHMVSWDGEHSRHIAFDVGSTVVVNNGLDAEQPRAARLATQLAQSSRPDPSVSWEPWLTIAAGMDVERTDPQALILRHVFEDRVYGSSSVSLVALSRNGIRYDFARVPDQPGPLSLSSST